MKKVYRWARISDGKLMTNKEMFAYCDEVLEFDEFTLFEEVYEHFDRLQYPITVEVDEH